MTLKSIFITSTVKVSTNGIKREIEVKNVRKEEAAKIMRSMGYTVTVVDGLIRFMVSSEEYDNGITETIKNALSAIGYDLSWGVKVENTNDRHQTAEG